MPHKTVSDDAWLMSCGVLQSLSKMERKKKTTTTKNKRLESCIRVDLFSFFFSAFHDVHNIFCSVWHNCHIYTRRKLDIRKWKHWILVSEKTNIQDIWNYKGKFGSIGKSVSFKWFLLYVCACVTKSFTIQKPYQI